MNPGHTSDRSLSRGELLALAALMVVVIAVRVVYLDADPIGLLEGGWFSDFGQYWKAARLDAMYGVWNVDDYNIGLWMAPGYTLALRAMFALLGVGFAQAFLVSALSGAVTTLLVYALARADAGPRQAMIAAALFGINPLTIVNDRSGYAESFQLVFIVLAVAGLLLRPRSRVVAVAGGLAAAYAVVAKLSGVIVAPILALTTIALLVLERRSAPAERLDPKRVALMAAAAGVGVAAFALFFLLPHRAVVARQFAVSSRDMYTEGGALARPDRVGLFGWLRLGFRPNGFFVMEAYLVVLVALVAAARIARRIVAPLTRVELACWIWLLVGGVYLASYVYQPDRRFLFLVPPLAILAGRFLGDAVTLDASRWASPRSRRVAGALAGAVLGMVAGFYLVRLGVFRTERVGALLGRAWDYSTAGSVFLTGATLVGAVAGFLAAPSAIRRHFGRAWLGTIAAAVVVLVMAQWTNEIAHRSYGMLRASQLLTRLTAGWPASQRVVVGWSAGTYTMGTDLLGVSFENVGKTAAQRYHPRVEVYTGSTTTPAVEHAIWRDPMPGREPKVSCAYLPLWSDTHGRPRNLITIMADSADVGACHAAAREPPAASAH